MVAQVNRVRRLSAVVQHLQVLEESGLVHTEKVGRVRTCRIETAGFSVLEQWIGDRRSTWERRLDRLGDLLAESDEGELRCTSQPALR